jgi:uncharacterized membrane protein (Fun14 family)
MALNVQKVSVGTVFGVCTGVAIKRLTKEAAYGAGVGFIFLQGLSHYGYITINMSKIKDDIEAAADQDGDGKFGASDVKIMIQKTIKFLSKGVPDAAGFTVGIYAGFKWL